MAWHDMLAWALLTPLTMCLQCKVGSSAHFVSRSAAVAAHYWHKRAEDALHAF